MCVVGSGMRFRTRWPAAPGLDSGRSTPFASGPQSAERPRRAEPYATVIAALLLCFSANAAELPYFAVLSEDAGAWPAILTSIGLQSRPASGARIFIARSGTPASEEWRGRIEQGAILILEGDSSLAEMFGFQKTRETIRVASLTDVHRPKLAVVWEQAVEAPVYKLPESARIFARERWAGAPLMAGFRRGSGAVLWLAIPAGERGYERFPYLLAALQDLGLEPPFRSARLWAFFDSAYRARVDLDYFAVRWRAAGIAALHVAAWHFYEPDPERDVWLAHLIATCHREGILVYAWLELPHVSEQFWEDHPEWREKTTVLQDAQLDWRKLMNLTNRDCFRAVSAGVRGLIGRFDWDGVNLAELYFESLEGMNNPSRFTPMNDDFRAAFRAENGFDPIDVFGPRRKDARTFLEFRAERARRIEQEWLEVIESARREKPYLDLVLTHVDDRFDTKMRDAIGSDAARVLPLLDRHSFTFMIEDPATIWHLGPQRYAALAERYQALTARRKRLAIDINIVERYQNVYPTKQQTGTELFQLVHQAAASFERVALYSENSLLPPDIPLLPAAAATVSEYGCQGSRITVESATGIGLQWKGAAWVDNQPWPVFDDATLWLPPGIHVVSPAAAYSGPRLLQVNADLKSARLLGRASVEFSYESASRAIALLDRSPVRIQIDGAETPISRAGTATLLLPRGQHVITVFTE